VRSDQKEGLDIEACRTDPSFAKLANEPFMPSNWHFSFHPNSPIGWSISALSGTTKRAV